MASARNLATAWLMRAVVMASLACAILAVAPQLGRFHWIPDLASHFRLPLALLTAVVLITTLHLRWVGWAMCAAGSFLAQAIPLVPFIVPFETETPADATTVRLLLANVYTANRQHQAVRELLLRERADIVGLLEVNQRWLDELDELDSVYPYRVEHPREHNFGLALLSRFPLDATEVRALEHEETAMIVAHLSIRGAPTALVLAHPVPPVTGDGFRLRNRQLGELARLRAEFSEEEFVLLGDLNTSPWSSHYARLEADAGLRNAAEGWGFAPTWPAAIPVLRIPIDHILVTPGLSVRRFRRGPDVGSDHFPILAEIERIEQP